MKMQKFISLIAVILLISVSLISCNKETDAPDGMKELSNDNNAYNFFLKNL